MTYQQFQQEIIHKVREAIPEEVTLTLQAVPKNNQVQLDGLTITPKGCNISPTIYLNSFYQAYREGTPFSEIVSQIARIYSDNRPTGSVNARFYTDFPHVKDKLMIKLIHYCRNKALLKDIPHLRCLDLAVVFYCLLSVTPSGSATILVRNSHLRLWDITPQELYRQALQNSVSQLPPSCAPLSDFLTPEELAASDTKIWLHMLTNRHKLFGAACMLYPSLLRDTAQRLDCDLVILPSSIHEVLLFPAHTAPSQEDLNEMVREVNLTQVSPEEILSDHVYYYSRKDNTLHYDRESYSCS